MLLNTFFLSLCMRVCPFELRTFDYYGLISVHGLKIHRMLSTPFSCRLVNHVYYNRVLVLLVFRPTLSDDAFSKN